MEKAFEKMLKLEFNSPRNALHYNAGENGNLCLAESFVDKDVVCTSTSTYIQSSDM